MEPTNDSRIFSTQWFVDPNHPLIENKVFYAQAGNLLYYMTAHRGPSTDNLEASPDKVRAVMLNDQTELKDTSLEAMEALRKVLNTPVR